MKSKQHIYNFYFVKLNN